MVTKSSLEDQRSRIRKFRIISHHPQAFWQRKPICFSCKIPLLPRSNAPSSTQLEASVGRFWRLRGTVATASEVSRQPLPPLHISRQPNSRSAWPQSSAVLAKKQPSCSDKHAAVAVTSVNKTCSTSPRILYHVHITLERLKTNAPLLQ